MKPVALAAIPMQICRKNSGTMNIAARVILMGLASAGTCLAQEPQASSQTSRLPDIAARGPSLALSQEAAQTALDACKALGANVSVSVVDSAGVLKLVLASDGTHARGVATSTRKAITAKDFNMPISELDKKITTDSVLATKVKANPYYLVGQGGFPLRVGDEVIGGIGVGGAPNGGGDPASPEYSFPSRDEKCALAALDKIRARLK